MAEQFLEAYDAVLKQWPLPVQSVELSSVYGTTHVNVCGPLDAPPLILLHGGGANSTVWFANVGELGAAHRTYAIDTIGDAGRSVRDGKTVKSLADLMDWLDTVLAGLGIESADLCGHSYGAWTALNYALHAPQRVRRLVLLDPTQCFAGFSLSCLWRAVPLLLRPNARRTRAYLAWETGGAQLDPAWLAVYTLGAERPKSFVNGRKPKPAQLRTLTMPLLVILAERSKAHDIRRVEANARKTVDQVRVEVLPGASHHTIPTEHGAELGRRIAEFLA